MQSADQSITEDGVRGDLSPDVQPRALSSRRTLFEYLCFSAATMLLVTLGGVIASLVIGAWPAFQHFGFDFLTSAQWNPVTETYGALGPIVGTLVTSFIALLIALPAAASVAFFLTEICPDKLRHPIGVAIELLAGIPSIVYGMWGLFVFAPFFSKHVQLPLMMAAEPGSWLETLVAGVPNGTGILSASIILSIMILPFMAATLRDLLLSVPPALRESAYALGATTAEVTTKVLLPYVRVGAVGAVMLGLGRALGETMAVTFIIGNAHRLPGSLFDSGSTIASTIANEFAEAHSPLHMSALVALGLILFLITFTVLGFARFLLRRRQGA